MMRREPGQATEPDVAGGVEPLEVGNNYFVFLGLATLQITQAAAFDFRQG
jgi:hypothetical protein